MNKEKIEEMLDMLFIEEVKYDISVGNSTTANTIPNLEKTSDTTGVARNIVGKEAVATMIVTIIQQERKKAIEDFVKYIYSRPSNEWIFPSNMFYEYLKESEK